MRDGREGRGGTGFWNGQWGRLALLVGALGVILFLLDPYVAELPSALRLVWRRPRWLLVTLAVDGMCLLTLALGVLHRRLTVRWLVIGLLVSICAAHAAYAVVLRHPAQLFDFQLMGQETAQARGAIHMYERLWLPRLVITGGLLIVICAGAARLVPLRSSRSFFVLAPAVFGAIYGLTQSRDNLPVIYPSFFAVPALVLNNLMFRRASGPREPVHLAADAGTGPRFIVYLVDESTRGDLLSINGAPVDTTPFLRQTELFNFGVSSAVANCSATSNLILRNGLVTLPDTAERAFRTPNLFQYAHAAGYRTVFIEGQRFGGVLQNYLTHYDMDHVDDFHWMTEARTCGRSGDCFLVEKIVETMRRGAPAVIYAVKMGSHTPYQSRYPETRTVFAPTLAPDEAMVDRERTLNSYYNALRWNVDDFFADLLPQIANQDYLLVYTSDHGQTILENGSLVTHCTERTAAPTEANVPLFALSTHPATRAALLAALPHHAGRATDYDIFPSLLRVMGYPTAPVRALYGPSLFDDEQRVRRFFAGNAFSSTPAVWRDFPTDGSPSSPSAAADLSLHVVQGSAGAAGPRSLTRKVTTPLGGALPARLSPRD